MTIRLADIIIGVTKSVTKDWTRQRKAEERGSSSLLSREFAYSKRDSFLEMADDVLPEAYDHASGGGMYSVSKRQLYYASRERFKQRTDRELNADYFSQTLLVQYMNCHPETATWKVTADPRGTFTIPNTAHEVRIPCGTLEIEKYLDSAGQAGAVLDTDVKVPTAWPSQKHGQRYQAVLYIEKEGFEPQLKEANVASRFDLAIVSCKGQSVVAARHLVDQVCNVDDGVPLLVVHDFDKAGFEISQRLTQVSAWAEAKDRVAYRFENKINVTDLGLRLTDIKKYGLASESVTFKGPFASDSICTPAEREFLRSGKRVELNAFTSPQFIEWLEAKLTALGLARRLVPSGAVLVDAFERARVVAHVNRAIDNAMTDAEQLAADIVIPRSLRRKLLKAMRERPEESWDQALYRLAQNEFRDGN